MAFVPRIREPTREIDPLVKSKQDNESRETLKSVDKPRQTTIIEELMDLLDDPNIDLETKGLLINSIRSIIELAKRARSQPNS